MAAKPAWGNLPSVIIVEILSHMSVTDKFRAASTCTRWRNYLFHASLWRKHDFRFKYGSRKCTRFLTDAVGRFVKEATIEFNSKFYADVRDCLVLLKELGKNGNLEKLVLKPISFQVSWPEQEISRPFQENLLDSYIDAIDDLINNSRNLRQLSLGCIPEFTDHTDEFIRLLEVKQFNTIESLHIASVKEDPDALRLLELSVHPFRSFEKLHNLSVDYDYFTTDLLSHFITAKRRVPLSVLSLHVHGLKDGRDKISNMMWERVVQANPNLAVTLSLLHTIDACANLSDILRPAMPLVNFRMLFCQGMNVNAINFISRFMNTRLESVYIVDGLDHGIPMSYDFVADEDPFVMMAWKCANLKHFSLIGYDMSVENITAMARLRGSQLKTFYIPRCCVSIIEEAPYDQDAIDWDTSYTQLLAEVSSCLGRPWHSVHDEDLPLAVTDPLADAESAYLDLLLSDQRV